MDQKQDTTLQILPNLPEPLNKPQCVYFPPNEILICGSYYNPNCYSYHTKKQQYKRICSYPDNITLWTHTVVSYYSYPSFNNTFNHNNIFFNLISFGGEHRSTAYHTLMMDYKSIWNDNDNDNDNDNNNNDNNNDDEKQYQKNININKWFSLPNHFLIGDKEKHDLIGARALIGGSQQHLLFITRFPNNIDVINLKSFEYLENIKNNILPVPNDNEVFNHCFVSRNTNNNNNNNNNNEFILMSDGNTLLIEYDEIKNKFYYQQLSSFHSPFRNFYRYAFAYWNHCIFIFGGYNWKQSRYLDKIWKLEMKENNYMGDWKECNFKMPIEIEGSFAVVNENDSSIHIIGGRYREYQNTHYIMSTLMRQDIEKILEHWIRVIKLKMGWIYDFHRMITNYINGIYTDNSKRLSISNII